MIEYDSEANLDAIAFEIEHNEGKRMPFMLRANIEGCLAALKHDNVPR